MTTVAKIQNGNVKPFLSSWIDDWFDREFNTMFAPVVQGRQRTPALNVQETDDQYLIELAAPGMNKKDFHVTVDNNILTISSEKEETVTDNDRPYTRKEFSYSSFHRSLSLPESANPDKIEASYKDGILHVVVPKREEAKRKPAKTITIK